MQPKNSRSLISRSLFAFYAVAAASLTAANTAAPPSWDAPERSTVTPAPITSAATGTFRLRPQGGVLAFDAATALSRPGLRIAAVGGGQTVYRLTTPDNLRKLEIQNPGRTSWQIVGREGVLSDGVAEGAFVAFDNASGKIVSVAVYQYDRTTQSEPEAYRVGRHIVLRGRFLAVADTQRGRSLRRGASEVRLNAQTGIVAKTL